MSLARRVTAAFDPAQQKIRWDPDPEAWQDHPDTRGIIAPIRVASFAEARQDFLSGVSSCPSTRNSGRAPSVLPPNRAKSVSESSQPTSALYAPHPSDVIRQPFRTA